MHAANMKINNPPKPRETTNQGERRRADSGTTIAGVLVGVPFDRDT
jgi:hypothetical protein